MTTSATPSRPTFREDLWGLPDEPAFGFVEIRAGSFTMGAGDDEHVVDLPTYWIARYPTTVAQMRVQYQDRGTRPAIADGLQGPDDHPANWLGWHEALAYSEWLGEKLLEIALEADEDRLADAPFLGGLVRRSLHASLASEAEWEKAARGDAGGVYPWGDDFDPRRCNTKETGIGSTTPVGAFPDGISPYGVMDMSGNVWCMLRTVWGPSLEEPLYTLPYDPEDGREDLDADPGLLRCARGGAFTVEPERARSTFRDAIPTDSRDDADGFRVALSSQVPWRIPRQRGAGRDPETTS